MSEYIIWESDKTETTDYLGVKHGVSHFEKREEIVRCINCRFSLAHGNGCGRNQDIYDAEPDGFCKWGERREQ